MIFWCRVSCSPSRLCPGTAARALTAVTAPIITLVTSTYLSFVVQVKQVSMQLCQLSASRVYIPCSPGEQSCCSNTMCKTWPALGYCTSIEI